MNETTLSVEDANAYLKSEFPLVTEIPELPERASEVEAAVRVLRAFSIAAGFEEKEIESKKARLSVDMFSDPFIFKLLKALCKQRRKIKQLEDDPRSRVYSSGGTTSISSTNEIVNAETNSLRNSSRRPRTTSKDLPYPKNRPSPLGRPVKTIRPLAPIVGTSRSFPFTKSSRENTVKLGFVSNDSPCTPSTIRPPTSRVSAASNQHLPPVAEKDPIMARNLRRNPPRLHKKLSGQQARVLTKWEAPQTLLVNPDRHHNLVEIGTETEPLIHSSDKHVYRVPSPPIEENRCLPYGRESRADLSEQNRSATDKTLIDDIRALNNCLEMIKNELTHSHRSQERLVEQQRIASKDVLVPHHSLCPHFLQWGKTEIRGSSTLLPSRPREPAEQSSPPLPRLSAILRSCVEPSVNFKISSTDPSESIFSLLIDTRSHHSSSEITASTGLEIFSDIYARHRSSSLRVPE